MSRLRLERATGSAFVALFTLTSPEWATQNGAPPPAAEPPRSSWTTPLFLGAEPPECRTLELLRVGFAGEPGETEADLRARRLARARALAGELERGADFTALVHAHSDAPNASLGGVLDTFAPGVLAPEFERFLFAAEIDAVSAPIERDDGVYLLRRGERWAGCRAIRIAGDDEPARARAEKALSRLVEGEAFADVARDCSDDAASRERGGMVGVFERGPTDRLLKQAVFAHPRGEVFGPLTTPLGFYVAERIAPEDVPPELWESNWIRGRALLVSHRAAEGPLELNDRSPTEAARLADELARRARAEGADFGALAGEYDDDPGGRERRGDLGWLRRRHLGSHALLEGLFRARPGEVLGPFATPLGYALFQRAVE